MAEGGGGWCRQQGECPLQAEGSAVEKAATGSPLQTCAGQKEPVEGGDPAGAVSELASMAKGSAAMPGAGAAPREGAALPGAKAEEMAPGTWEALGPELTGAGRPYLLVGAGGPVLPSLLGVSRLWERAAPAQALGTG